MYIHSLKKFNNYLFESEEAFDVVAEAVVEAAIVFVLTVWAVPSTVVVPLALVAVAAAAAAVVEPVELVVVAAATVVVSPGVLPGPS